jgi:hypothetical protein
MSAPPNDNLDTPIWGAAAIAAEIGKTETQTNYLLIKRRLDADKVGKQWVSTRRRLRNQFAGAAAKQRDALSQAARAEART